MRAKMCSSLVYIRLSVYTDAAAATSAAAATAADGDVAAAAVSCCRFRRCFFNKLSVSDILGVSVSPTSEPLQLCSRKTADAADSV